MGELEVIRHIGAEDSNWLAVSSQFPAVSDSFKMQEEPLTCAQTRQYEAPFQAVKADGMEGRRDRNHIPMSVGYFAFPFPDQEDALSTVRSSSSNFSAQDGRCSRYCGNPKSMKKTAPTDHRMGQEAESYAADFLTASGEINQRIRAHLPTGTLRYECRASCG